VTATPVLVETVKDNFGDYVQEWYVEPPAVGVKYRPLRQEWDDQVRVRRIYEWEADADPRSGYFLLTVERPEPVEREGTMRSESGASPDIS
jgi:hypothetical protein